MSTFVLPESAYFTSQEPIKSYPWTKSFEEVKDEPFVILHTSGSTGIPKPVYVTHGVFASNDAHHLIPSSGGKPTFGDFIKGKRYILALPVFHSANLTFTMGFNVFFGVVCVLPPPVPMTVEVLDQVHVHGQAHGSLAPPSLLVDLCNNPDFLANLLQRLQFVTYVGGSLPQQVGDLISSKIKLMTLFGSTETKLFPIEVDDDSCDWEYISISPFLGHEFRPARDNLSELVIVRKEDLSLFQGVFSTFPTLQEYSTKDLCQQHPSKPGSWAFRARADDIISLNNAEKVNPVTMETLIMSHSAVKSAVVGGHGQFQTSLIVEPNQPLLSKQERSSFIRDIWPTVKQANRDCVAHGRIMKDFILIADPEKPIPKADKQTVQRSAAMKLYEDEFNALYNSRMTDQPEVEYSISKTTNTKENSNGVSTVAAGTHDKKSSLQKELTKIQDAELDARIEAVLHHTLPKALLKHLGPAIIEILNGHTLNGTHNDGNRKFRVNESAGHVNATFNANSKSGTRMQNLRRGIYAAISESTYLENVTDEANLFECGLDSLQVNALITEINGFLRESELDIKPITRKVLYAHPTVDQLVCAMV